MKVLFIKEQNKILFFYFILKKKINTQKSQQQQKSRISSRYSASFIHSQKSTNLEA